MPSTPDAAIPFMVERGGEVNGVNEVNPGPAPADHEPQVADRAGGVTPPRKLPVWRRPELWGAASLLCNPLLLLSVAALVFGWLSLRDRRARREPADEAWLGIGLGAAGALFGVLAHAMVALLGYGFHQGYTREMARVGPVQPADYDYLAARSRHRTRLTRHGPAPHTGKIETVPHYVTPVSYDSEGRRLKAWLMLPAGEHPVPGVVYLHGGLTLSDGDAANAYPFLAAGFAVLLPSYRGENQNPGELELLYGEVEDAKSAIRFLAGHPRVIDDRLSVFGHSLGGALSALVALEPIAGLRYSGSSGGLYPPNIFESWQGAGWVPFDTDDREERDLRTPVRFAPQLKVPHSAYIGTDDSLASELPRYRPTLDAAKQLAVETLPGDHESSVTAAVARFVRRIAEERDFDDRGVLADLTSGDAARERRARQALAAIRLPLSSSQASRLLRRALELDAAAQRTAPSARGERALDDRPAVLIGAAARSALPEELAPLDAGYHVLTPATRGAALAALLGPNDYGSLDRALLRLREERDPEVDFPAQALQTFNMEALFPKILDLGVRHPHALELFQFVLGRCDQVRAVSAAGAAGERFALEYFGERREPLLSQQGKAPGDWMYDDGYATSRYEGGLALDALGCFAAPSPERLRTLHAFEHGPDPLLRYYAVKALLALGQPVASGTIEAVTAWDETRAWLCSELVARGGGKRCPEAALTQEALARSHLVVWLTSPSELGRVPAAIEHVARVERDAMDYYVFRFRERTGSPWLAGVAGPYARGEPATEAPEEVFSSFTPIGAAPPGGHVDAIRHLFAEE